MATKADVRKKVQFMVNELGSSYLASLQAGGLGLDDAIWWAYERYAERVRAFRAEYTGATTANLAIYAYTDVDIDASRMFLVKTVMYDGEELEKCDEDTLFAFDTQWRTRGSGTPTYWTPYDEGRFRLYKKPSAALALIIDGYELPSKTYLLPAVGQAPPVEVDYDTDETFVFRCLDPHVDAISLWAAILVTVKDPYDENTLRASSLYPMWEKVCQRAERRIHGTDGTTPQYGRYAAAQPSGAYLIGDVTLL